MTRRSFVLRRRQLILLSVACTPFSSNGFDMRMLVGITRLPKPGPSRVVKMLPTWPRMRLNSRLSAQIQPENDVDDFEPNVNAPRSKVQQFSIKPSSLIISALLVCSGAILGPFLDSYHGAFGVLQYDNPIEAVLWGTDADHPALITSWWVPELFGLAGFIIGWLYIVLDKVLQTPDTVRNPSPPKILVGIALFTFQYWLSGVLFQSHVDRTTILNVMSVVAATGFVLLDGSIAGLITSVATALGGPLIEAGLLSLAKAGMMLDSGYHYTDPGETGFFPLWIAPVYFLGGPAVGNLARGYWDLVSTSSSASTRSRSLPGCKVCADTRQVPCPNCDGVGTYLAMGDRSVTCNSCQGRGYVICRSCFSHYNEDPSDVEAIRELMRRRPD